MSFRFRVYLIYDRIQLQQTIILICQNIIRGYIQFFRHCKGVINSVSFEFPQRKNPIKMFSEDRKSRYATSLASQQLARKSFIIFFNTVISPLPSLCTNPGIGTVYECSDSSMSAVNEAEGSCYLICIRKKLICQALYR